MENSTTDITSAVYSDHDPVPRPSHPANAIETIKLALDLISFDSADGGGGGDPSTWPLLDLDALAAALAFALAEAARRNDLGGVCSPRTVFDFPDGEVPSLPLREYIRRVLTYTRTGAEVFILALAYVDRISAVVPAARANVYRLFAAAATVATKFLDDRSTQNKFAAAVAGVSLAEFNALEAAFLNCCAFQLSVDVRVFAEYRSAVACLAAAFRAGGNSYAALRKAFRVSISR